MGGKQETTIAPTNTNDSANLASLLVCFLSILSVCLTTFNVYLFVWICSALTGSGGDQTPGSGLSLLNQLELFRDNIEGIKFNGRLLVKRPFNVEQVGQSHLMNAKSILRLTSANGVTFKAKNQSSSFSVSSKRNSLEFPSGLLVFGRPNNGEPMIDCASVQTNANSTSLPEEEATTESTCRLKAGQLKLTNPAGLDFSNLQSIQTNRVRTRRLHSPLQKVQLMTGSGAYLESLDDEIQLQALDLVSMGRRHSAESTVLIKAKSINLGALEEQKSSAASAKVSPLSDAESRFKLCICLLRQTGDELGANRKNETASRLGTNDWPNNGLVYAVQNKLKCSKFSERFCNPVNKRNINN